MTKLESGYLSESFAKSSVRPAEDLALEKPAAIQAQHFAPKTPGN